MLLSGCEPKHSLKPIPQIIKENGQSRLMVDGEPFIILGGQVHNSSSSSSLYMEPLWEKFTRLNFNTVLVPVTWELIEPEEGRFDFKELERLILGARQNNLRLVILWFATWKNGQSTYAPEWVRKDTERFQRSMTEDGKLVNHISVFSEETMKADAKAFAALMRHIKTFDEKDRTVITVQVQNEPGIRFMLRDYSPAANKAFASQVPEKLMSFLEAKKGELIPEMLEIWSYSNYSVAGTWSELFGNDSELMFMSWYTATYIDYVTKAGKNEYPLPMYANAWLYYSNYRIGRNPLENWPRGGPIDIMIPVWQAAAPHIEALAPDIYRPDFVRVAESFQRMGNPLFIPETHSRTAPANVFYAVGERAICFSPFGVDNLLEDHPLGASYELLNNLMPILTEHQFKGKTRGFVAPKGETKEIDLGKYLVRIEFAGNENLNLDGYGLIIELNEDEFLFAGNGYKAVFIAKPGDDSETEILEAWQLIYKDNEWIKERRLNGDETRHSFALLFRGQRPDVKSVRLFSYKGGMRHDGYRI